MPSSTRPRRPKPKTPIAGRSSLQFAPPAPAAPPSPMRTMGARVPPTGLPPDPAYQVPPGLPRASVIPAYQVPPDEMGAGSYGFLNVNSRMPFGAPVAGFRDAPAAPPSPMRTMATGMAPAQQSYLAQRGIPPASPRSYAMNPVQYPRPTGSPMGARVPTTMAPRPATPQQTFGPMQQGMQRDMFGSPTSMTIPTAGNLATAFPGRLGGPGRMTPDQARFSLSEGAHGLAEAGSFGRVDNPTLPTSLAWQELADRRAANARDPALRGGNVDWTESPSIQNAMQGGRGDVARMDEALARQRAVDPQQAGELVDFWAGRKNPVLPKEVPGGFFGGIAQETLDPGIGHFGRETERAANAADALRSKGATSTGVAWAPGESKGYDRMIAKRGEDQQRYALARQIQRMGGGAMGPMPSGAQAGLQSALAGGPMSLQQAMMLGGPKFAGLTAQTDMDFDRGMRKDAAKLDRERFEWEKTKPSTLTQAMQGERDKAKIALREENRKAGRTISPQEEEAELDRRGYQIPGNMPQSGAAPTPGMQGPLGPAISNGQPGAGGTPPAAPPPPAAGNPVRTRIGNAELSAGPQAGFYDSNKKAWKSPTAMMDSLFEQVDQELVNDENLPAYLEMIRDQMTVQQYKTRKGPRGGASGAALYDVQQGKVDLNYLKNRAANREIELNKLRPGYSTRPAFR